MINKTANSFSIQDMESLSGIKIPTIRIWEKRYQVFSPKRTKSNIRIYDMEDLIKLLNIAYLKEKGHRISKLAKLSNAGLAAKAKETYTRMTDWSHIDHELMVCMLNYDLVHFQTIYRELETQYTFHDLFIQAFIPFFEKLGRLWQTKSITPMHEHFISNQVLQKLFAEIDALSKRYVPNQHRKIQYVLFLPENENHEIGLLFLYYQFLLRNEPVIYLGQNVPVSRLQEFAQGDMKSVFVGHFTIAPQGQTILDFIHQFEPILHNTNHEFWATGLKVNKTIPPSKQIQLFPRISDMVHHLDTYLV